MTPPVVAVKVWGEFALFTRPELSVERISYPIMTPSAARGILDAILYKPQMHWHVRRIKALRPHFPQGFPDREANATHRLVSIRRNEIQGTISERTVQTWIDQPATCQPYLVDSAGRSGAQGENRTQRTSLVLQHVAYQIEASPKLTARANQPRTVEDAEDSGPDTIAKYVAMFQRRVAKGQCFHRPYLGIREFVADFAPPDERDVLLDWSDNFGFMLYDLQHNQDGTRRPGFFEAKIRNGILHCDTEAEGPEGESPITIHGWSYEGEEK